MRIHYTLEGANGDTVNGQPVSLLHPLPVTGSFSAQTTALATASPPTYSEGATASLSTDLNGNLRIAGTFSASVTDMLNKTGSGALWTASAPAFANGVDVDAADDGDL